ncbi:efflux RND transporter periplasmic adaptor subunit [uncultured Brevibacillus sp.]|uniref:efflux RND transporter periplasmic adaptor subunit n=1 Tax=uncultured Brevibacillus sp. TaxID=169970 RepID=UPI0025993F61|nr:efflux RND transporter periplasmic adaptor subunit [uncultured Brevibacillus sp.]
MKQRKQGVIALVAVMLLSACGPAPKEAEVEQAIGKRVAVIQVKEDSPVQVSKWSGVLKPSEETQAAFETNGRIVALAVEEGDYVTQGSLLASVDNRDLSLQAASAAASVQQAQAQLAQVNNGAREEELIQSQNALEKSKVNLEKAKADLQRSEELFRQGALSQNDLETVQNRMALAQKDWENAEQAYALVKNGPRQEVRQQTAGVYQQAVVGQQRAALSQSKAQLTAPISGVVLEKMTAVGQLASTGSAVYRIGNVDALLVEFSVPDREIGLWRKGDQVKISLYKQERVGMVKRVLPAVSQQSGTVPVEVVIPNPQRDWLVGQVVSASMERFVAKGIFVPVEAVLSKGEKQPYVFVAKDKKAVKTPVTLGIMANNQLQIQSGLSVGNLVITKGVDQLFDGDDLDVISGEQP